MAYQTEIWLFAIPQQLFCLFCLILNGPSYRTRSVWLCSFLMFDPLLLGLIIKQLSNELYVTECLIERLFLILMQLFVLYFFVVC